MSKNYKDAKRFEDTNIIEFIGNAYPYSISQLMKVKFNSVKSGAKKRMKQLEYDEGEIIVSYILKIFYTGTSIDINDIFTILDKEMYIDALFKLYQSLLLCMKNLFNMFPDMFVRSLRRDDEFFVALN